MFRRLTRRYKAETTRPGPVLPAMAIFSQDQATIQAWQGRHEAQEPMQTLVGQKSRPANVVSDVLVPLLQAVITGALAALFVKYVAGNDDTAPAWGLGALVTVWLIQLIEVRKLVWAAEQVFHIDLDRDHYQGRPPGMPPVILNNRGPAAVKANGQPVVISPNPEHPYESFVRGCERVGTDIRQWESYGIPRKVYQKWRDQLIRGGWAMWNSYDAAGRANTTQGWHLLAKSEEILANSHILEEV